MLISNMESYWNIKFAALIVRRSKMFKKDQDITVKLKRKIFIYSVIEIALIVTLLAFIMVLIMIFMN